jgi:hypothetical protein
MAIDGLEWMDTVVSMPLMKLPVRTVIVPLPAGRVLLSPGSVLTAEAIQKAGPFTDIVVPTLFHLSGARIAAAVFPQARLWGPKGCMEKAPGMPWTHVLGVDPWPHEAALAWIPIEGMPRAAESVFLHRASRTLLVADFVFNVTEIRGPGPWLILSVFGTYRKLGVSRLFLRLVADRPAFEASVGKILALDFDQLVPSHGEIVADTARARLSEALKQRGIRC